MNNFDINGFVESKQFEELCHKVGELIVEGLEGYSSLECTIAARHLVSEVSFRCGAMGIDAYTKDMESKANGHTDTGV